MILDSRYSSFSSDCSQQCNWLTFHLYLHSDDMSLPSILSLISTSSFISIPTIYRFLAYLGTIPDINLLKRVLFLLPTAPRIQQT